MGAMGTPYSMDEAIRSARRLLAEARTVAVLTGAGISAESGVPTFRGDGGLWRQYRPEHLASRAAFERDPALVWEWYRWRRARVAEAIPNAGHDWLVALERGAPAFDLITQNVDGLHRRAGSRRVTELHGNLFRTVCSRRCGASLDDSPWARGGPAAEAPVPVPMCACGAPMRPGVVWFGESLDEGAVSDAVHAAERADVMVVIGTSALVQPAAALPILTRQAGGSVVEINPEETPLSDLARVCLRGPAAVICPRLEVRW
jgi:NAD-dependent deacetylase